MFLRRTRSSESGVAVLLLAASLSVIMLLIGIALVLGFYWLVRSEVQGIADAAAQNASAVLGVSDPSLPSAASAKLTWAEARTTAINVVNTYLAQRSPGLPSGYSVVEAPGTHWDGPNFQVDIERGRWLPAVPGVRAAVFESYEDDWQDLHPGMPAEVAGNSVRVRIKIPGLLPLASWIGSAALPVEAHSVGLARPVSEVTAAPFAIPVCALLDETGDMNRATLCIADRLLTAASRYCPPGNPNCAIVPDFSWDPILPVDPQSVWPFPIAESSSTDNACFWASPHFSKVESNFGVIGLPGVTSSPNEQQIQVKLSGPHPGVTSSIGDSFWVLEQGLADPATNDIIWNQIINGAGGDLDTHPAYGDTDLQAINSNKNMAFRVASLSDRSTTCSATDYSTTSPVANKRPIRPGWGTCNSTRVGWGHWSNFDATAPFPPPPHNSCVASYVAPGVLPNSLSSQIPVWKTQVAVIADPSGPGCRGMAGAGSFDPPIVSAHPYEVIGFISVNIFDVDIGRDSPSYPHPCGLPTGFADYGAGAVDATFPWGFQRNPGSPDRCNLVRTRIACDTNFVASTSSSGPGQTSLVE